jgi:hypothetical protein
MIQNGFVDAVAASVILSLLEELFNGFSAGVPNRRSQDSAIQEAGGL